MIRSTLSLRMPEESSLKALVLLLLSHCVLRTHTRICRRHSLRRRSLQSRFFSLCLGRGCVTPPLLTLLAGRSPSVTTMMWLARAARRHASRPFPLPVSYTPAPPRPWPVQKPPQPPLRPPPPRGAPPRHRRRPHAAAPACHGVLPPAPRLPSVPSACCE